MKKRILSGMRPTGPLHLGHLFGALDNWVKLQEGYDCFFMVADWHALMSEYEDPSNLSKYILECVADWIASGIDPEKSTIFIQSHVKEHLDLYMIFSDFVPLGWLERCPTYKEQLRELSKRRLHTYGFLGYPVLQAADILLYRAYAVPVGQDQLPHLELTNDIAEKFNNIYPEARHFSKIKPLLTDMPKLLGIDARKMSKSYGNFIALGDSEKEITQKCSKMFTDPKRIKLSDKGHPDTCNLYAYYKLLKKGDVPKVFEYCTKAKLGCTECKKDLADLISDYLSDIRMKRENLLKDKDKIYSILEHGAQKARKVASETMSEVKKAIGMV
ncbi:MAG: tryptophan--tRNA ligase [Candidatus Omnitrophica bacterium]|nr:tryptophan--tRNA ligase [Candidatus Omnitrophota bacterium]MBU1852514.1 tryptophan--tRNA ligase [Candidatus Omnitrophota bacterium]